MKDRSLLHPDTDAGSSASVEPAALNGIARRLDRLVGRVAEARLSAVAAAVRRENLTYLSPAKICVIEDAIRRLNRNRVPGDFLEFGVALGGSAIIIASRLDASRQFHGYDVFGMIPPPGPKDDTRSHERYRVIREGESGGIGGGTYYGYLPDLYDCVHQTFDRFGLTVDGERIVLHRGLFQDTFDPEIPRKVAFAHIDCDWYEPVWFCLGAVRRRLSPGGCIVLDDYNDYGGCRRAVDAFLDEHTDFQLVRSAPNAVLRRD